MASPVPSEDRAGMVRAPVYRGHARRWQAPPKQLSPLGKHQLAGPADPAPLSAEPVSLAPRT